MKKITAVIKREYLTRVKKKSFIIITILMPLSLLLLMGMPFLMAFLKTGTTEIAILSDSSLFSDNIKGNSNINITFVAGEHDIWKEGYQKEGYDALLYIPDFDLRYPGGVRMYSERQIGIGQTAHLREQINEVIEVARFKDADIDKDLVDKLRTRLQIESIIISKDGKEETSNAIVSFIMGQGMAFFMYFLIFIYGSMIMKCVIDEKKNRIVEILVSSIKPFDLMCGKIVGIACVALTQLLIWLILTTMIFAFFIVGVIPYMESTNATAVETASEMTPAQTNMAMDIADFISNPGALNITAVLIAFSFYFIFGYLFYSTLFAAVGSVSDDETQAQTFTLPISIPVILSILIVANIAENPHSGLAIWTSIIPFSSPIVMLARLPFNVPLWQIIISGLTLILSFLGCTWAAGKIYRTGILLYGKKLNWKDLWKFVRA